MTAPRPRSHPVLVGASPLSWGELADRTAGTRALLAELPPGSRVAAGLRDDAALAVLFAACLAQQLVLVVLDPGGSAAQAHRALVAGQVRAAFLAPDLAERWTVDSSDTLQLWRHEPLARPTLFSRLLGSRSPASTGSWPACATALAPLSRPPGNPPAGTAAVVLRTSGSTGQARLAVLTQANLAAQAATMSRQLGLGPDDRVLVLSPTSHVDGLTALYTALATGRTLVRFGDFTVPRIPALLDAFYRHRVTHAVVTPTLLRLLLHFGPALGTALATGDLRLVVSTAEPLDAALWRRFEAQAGVPLCDMYGMTEVGNVLFSGPDAESRQVGSVGLPVDAAVRIVDPEGQPVAQGEPGELQVRGPSVFAGYLGQPGTEPWFSTGDLGSQGASGHVTLSGRCSGVVIVGGRNVDVGEVARALETHPAVHHAAALGVPDALWGERLVAAVAVAEGAATSGELLAHVAGAVAEYAVPRSVHLFDELPLLRSGKLDRARILADIGARVTAQGPGDPEPAERVLVLAAEAFRVPRGALSLASRATDTRGWDSMAHLDLVLRLEQVFDIQLRPGQIMALDSLQAAVELVEALRSRPDGR